MTRERKLAADDEQRMVWAEVYAPDIPDTEGDFMNAATIRKMAYGFLRNKRVDSIDMQHDNKLVEGASIVESFIARKGDPDFIEGAWVVGMHVNNDDVWGKIKNGVINGFSLEALVTRAPTIIEMELPPILEGTTSKSDNHEHRFFVAYDEAGKFLGGRTDVVEGHAHLIKRGTTTEEAGEDKHAHRFSYIEGIKAVEMEKST